MHFKNFLNKTQSEVQMNNSKVISFITELSNKLEILPLNPNGEINSQYAHERTKNCKNYLINNVYQIERYFDTFKCFIGFEKNGTRYMLFPSKKCNPHEEFIIKEFKTVGVEK